MAPMGVEVRRSTNRSAESQPGNTGPSPVLKVNKMNTPGTSGRRRSSNSLDSSTPSKSGPCAVVASHEANGDDQGGLGVNVKLRVREINGISNGQGAVPLDLTKMGKGKGKGKMQPEDSGGSLTNSELHDTGEAGLDSLTTRTDEIEQLLDEMDQRETKYWEEVERKEDQLTEVDARKTKIRKDMLNDRFTEEDKRELTAKYKRLQEIQQFAEEEIEGLQKRLAKAKLTIKDLRKELAEVRKALEEKEKEGHLLQRTVNGLEKQVTALKEELDVTKTKLKKYEEKYPELEESDVSTPTSSQVSFETPKDSPAIQDPRHAESSSRRGSQLPAAQTEPGDREGSPDGTIQDPDEGTPLEKVSSGSSGTRTCQKSLGKVLSRDSQTSRYLGAVPGTTVVKEITQTLHENGHHKSRKDHHQKKGHGKKSSKGSN